MNLRVWINAFIPRDVPGYTKLISRGTHATKTAVPLPGLARLNPLNLFKNLDAGYLTDQRSFSADLAASSRMQSMVEFKLTPKVEIVASRHSSSGTTEVDMDTGRQLGYAVSDMRRCSFSQLRTQQPTPGVRPGSTQYRVPLGGRFTVNYPTSQPPADPSYSTRVVGQADDPLVSTAADIDYEGLIDVTVDPSDARRCIVIFEGKIDAFPAFECYAQLGGSTKTIFTAAPPPGNTVTDLLGGANRSIRGIASFP